MAVFQRPLVADDAEHPLAGELHLAQHLLVEILAVVQCQIHLGDAFVGFGDRHLDVVDERGEQRPLLVRLTQRIQIAELLAGRAQTVPGGQVDAGLRPCEHPRDRTQIVQRLGAQTTLGRAGADR